MKTKNKGIFIIIGILLMIPVIFSASMYYPGAVRTITWAYHEGQSITYTETGEKIVVMLILWAFLMFLVWSGINEKKPETGKKKWNR